MGKFKVGDRIKCVDAGDCTFLTDDREYAVTAVDGGFVDAMWDNGRTGGMFESRFELVDTTWVPKVGDPVRYDDDLVSGEGVLIEIAYDHWLVEVEQKDRTFAYYRNDTCREFYSLNNLSPLADAVAQPAAFTIEAGKTYATRGGRKVGPLLSFGEDRLIVAKGDGNIWLLNGKAGQFNVDPDDLVSEWIDEPVAVAASNDNGAPAKFKVGDVVGSTENTWTKYRVTGVKAGRINVDSLKADGSKAHSHGWFDDDIFFVAEAPAIKPTAIVALIENGQPKPATRPYVHTTEESATKEAERLALLHPGQEFGVYVLAGSKIADEVITKTAVLRAA